MTKTHVLIVEDFLLYTFELLINMPNHYDFIYILWEKDVILMVNKKDYELQ